MLRGMVSTRIVPNTMIAEISVESESSNETAEIANTMAEAYQAWLFKRYGGRQEEYINEIDKKVRDVETGLNHLRETLKVPAPEPSMSELGTNYPVFHQAKLELNFYQYSLRRSIEETNAKSATKIHVVVETAVPPTAPLRHKKALGLISLGVGLACCGWGWKLVRDLRTADGAT
jgi:hypothetical protein